MRLALASAVTICTVAIATSALAQPRPSRRRGPSRRPPPSGQTKTPPGHTKTPPGQAKKGADPRACRSREAAISNDERRLEEWRARVAGIGAEINELRDRIKQLDSERNMLNRQIKPTEQRIAQQKKLYDEQCKQSEDCARYERLALDLDRRTKPVEDSMERVRSEINLTRKDVDDLRRRIEPLRKEYNDKRCNNLVPGETAQETIDRCAAIFSEWNRLQADLNRQNDRLARLQSTYQSLYSQLQSTEQRAKQYESYLAANCQKSQQLQTVRRYSGVRKRAEDLHKELDRLVKDVTKLRGIRITVE